MHKVIGVAAILAVVALSLAIAAPVLANGGEKADYLVQPTIGGPNNPHTHYPPGAPTVTIPTDNPAIGGLIGELPAEPGDVFWSTGVGG